MPHLPIIVDLIGMLEQAEQYHEQISHAIEHNEYEGKRLEDAQALRTNLEGFLTTTKATLDTHVANIETFLGI